MVEISHDAVQAEKKGKSEVGLVRPRLALASREHKANLGSTGAMSTSSAAYSRDDVASESKFGPDRPTRDHMFDSPGYPQISDKPPNSGG